MSSTLQFGDMIKQLKGDSATGVSGRIPIGLTDAYCAQELNKAWRMVEQSGAFVWNIRTDTITLVLDTSVPPPFRYLNKALLPADMDIGKPASIYPAFSGAVFFYEIINVPAEEFARSLVLHSNLVDPLTGSALGYFSCWTIRPALPVPPPPGPVSPPLYYAEFSPRNAIPPPPPQGSGNVSFSIYYHKMMGPAITDGTQYLPTPDEFDDLFIDLAEAEIRRQHEMTGWDVVQKKAEAEMKALVDKYRSGKKNLAGMQEQSFQTAEAAAERAE